MQPFFVVCVVLAVFLHYHFRHSVDALILSDLMRSLRVIITLTTFLWDGPQKDIKIQAKESHGRQAFYEGKLKGIEEKDIGEQI